MKPIALLLFTAAVLALSSCSSTSFLERKYRPGFYLDRKGDHSQTAPIAAQEKPELLCTEKAGYENTAAGLVAGNTAQATVAPSPAKTGTVAPPRKTIEAAPVKVSAHAQEPAGPLPGEEKPEKEEATLIREAFLFALAGIGLIASLFLLIIILSLASLYLPFFWGSLIGITLLASSCVASFIGFSKARKVSKNHKAGEQYEGRRKVVFAKAMGIAWLVILSAGVIGALVALYIGLMNSF